MPPAMTSWTRLVAMRAARVMMTVAAVGLLVAAGSACDTSRKEPLVRGRRSTRAAPTTHAAQPALAPSPSSGGQPAGKPAGPAGARDPKALTDADLPVETDFEVAAETEITPQNYKAELSALAAEITADSD